MGRIIKGILGGVSGKVGTVVGGRWRDVEYLRSLPAISKNKKRTANQMVHQAKFGFVTKFLKHFGRLLKYSYEETTSMTKKNQAVKHAISNALVGNYPDIAIDFAKLKLAKGSRTMVMNPEVSSPDTSLLKFTWTDNSVETEDDADQSILIAYCPELDSAIFSVTGAARETGEATLNVKYFTGKEVHVWMSFRSLDAKYVADSVYLGSPAAA